VFLDRDGVLIEDVDLVTSADQIRLLLQSLRAAGFALVVVTNQPVVARGLATEEQVGEINAEIARRLAAQGAPGFDAFYFCPHHPRASLPQYRLDCDCRKPRPGLLPAS
jgi:D-glycero-D-manno-heptose 1,7-bisphosphate phosphatase